MPNMAALLKEEVRRLARKEVRASIRATQQILVHCRRDITHLKRLVQEQQKKLATVVRQIQNRRNHAHPHEEELAGVRYSARSVRAQRRRLGLSAEEYGRLLGVSGLTIYNWEHGKARPRRAQMVALVAARGIGKREALVKLGSRSKEAADAHPAR
jgi:DNA-binding transcriptional regulator YiaG